MLTDFKIMSPIRIIKPHPYLRPWNVRYLLKNVLRLVSKYLSTSYLRVCPRKSWEVDFLIHFTSFSILRYNQSDTCNQSSTENFHPWEISKKSRTHNIVIKSIQGGFILKGCKCCFWVTKDVIFMMVHPRGPNRPSSDRWKLPMHSNLYVHEFSNPCSITNFVSSNLRNLENLQNYYESWGIKQNLRIWRVYERGEG